MRKNNMQRTSIAILSALFLLSVLTACTPTEDPLIPRAVLFGDPDRAGLQISPDGNFISFLAPVNGVMNVWIAPTQDIEQARPVSQSTVRGIRSYFWTHTGAHLLYLQDDGGDENFMLHRVHIETGEDVNLTPFGEIPDADGNPILLPDGKNMRPRVHVEAISPQHPEEIIIGINNRDPKYFDLYRLDIVSGEMTILVENDSFSSFHIDDDYAVRLASKTTESGGTAYFAPDGSGGWTPAMAVDADDQLTTSIAGFTTDGSIMYMRDSRGRNTAALYAVDTDSGERRELASHDKADVSSILRHPRTRHAQAVAAEYDRISWQILDEDIADDFAYLATVVDGDFFVSSRTLDDAMWTVIYRTDDSPTRMYLYDRANKQTQFLFTDRTVLEETPLTKMTPVIIPARDGLELVCYLSVPRTLDKKQQGRPAEAIPMVLLVHGGPWARDRWGYNSAHQWLANRGYAVLSVNYRGSTGFGKAFANAARLEWAGKMHDDLIDAVDWAVAEGITTREQVAIMGGSYGGYATLVGLTFTPDRFACGVDIVGPSNLRTLLETIPPYWKPQLDFWADRIGDPRTEEGRALLEERSPLNYVDNIRRPLLIGQGANDPRVKQSESDQIVRVMQEKDIPVTYVLYPDEGHGFVRPENRLSFFAITEHFLAQHLHGRSEPFGKDFHNSSLTVPEGATLIPGLLDTLND
jgi:dipeptidyl aminopeptidase/acylaminoacyl peptidase